MKKINLGLSIFCLIMVSFFLITSPSSASAKVSNTKKPVVIKKVVIKPVAKLAPVSWSASGLKSVARIPSGVRPAYKKKVENYARRNHIKLITAGVVDGMRE